MAERSPSVVRTIGDRAGFVKARGQATSGVLLARIWVAPRDGVPTGHITSAVLARVYLLLQSEQSRPDPISLAAGDSVAVKAPLTQSKVVEVINRMEVERPIRGVGVHPELPCLATVRCKGAYVEVGVDQDDVSHLFGGQLLEGILDACEIE